MHAKGCLLSCIQMKYKFTNLSVLGKIKVPEALLVLCSGVLGLERFIAAVLLEGVQKTQRIAQPQDVRVQVVRALFDHFPEAVDCACQQRAYFFVVVDKVRVTNAHEDDVRRQTRQ